MPSPVWKMDDSRWPVALVYVADGDGRAAPDIESFIALADRLVALRERKAVVLDLTHAKPDAARRRRIIDWARSHWASIRADLAAVAAVAPGATQRGFITSMLWFMEPPCPMKVFGAREPAIAWAKAELSRTPAPG